MGDRNDLSKLSDDEFLVILKRKQEQRNWTMRELLEIERRGDDFLAKDPDLKNAIRTLWDDITKGMSEAVAPFLENLKVSAEIGRKLSVQFQGIGEKLAANMGLDSLKIAQKKSIAYKSALDATKLSIAPNLTDIARVGSSAYDNLFKASQITSLPWIERHLLSDGAVKSLTLVAMDVSDNAKRNADIFKQFSSNLDNTRVQVQNSINPETVALAIDDASLDLTANDPQVPAKLTAPIIQKIETDEQSYIQATSREIEKNTAETNTHLKSLKEIISSGAIPRWVTMAGVIAGVVAALEGFYIIVWK